MAAYHGAVTYRDIFRRGCVSCPDTNPSCPPSCPDGQECSLVPFSCTTCQHTVCVRSVGRASESSTSKAASSGPNLGAIIGGVVGGLICIAIATYLVWRFCIKAKRQQYAQSERAEQDNENRETEKDLAMRRDARNSTHTARSIPSTVLTRASNIIQIAYIPGITNRSAVSTPGLLVPPVPPIPSAQSPGSPNNENEHFFMPGALRDSTYSGISDRTSYTRNSTYTRNSVASTIYGKNPIVSPVPAQTIIRGKAAMVSVRQNGGRSGEATPPMPSIDYDKFRMNGPPSPVFSIGSTFLNNATMATQVKAKSVKTIGSNPSLKTSQVPQVIVTDKDGVKVDTSKDSKDSNVVTTAEETSSVEQGPFSDPSPAMQSTTSLSDIIDKAAKKQEKPKAEKEEEGTPFSDENALKE